VTDESADFVALFGRIPLGWSEVHYTGRRYGVTSSIAANGRKLAVYAEELGGRDVISANLYLTAGGAQLKPCEMPAAKVIDFLSGLEPLASPDVLPGVEGIRDNRTSILMPAAPRVASVHPMEEV
jgi:hypothetical protein